MQYKIVQSCLIITNYTGYIEAESLEEAKAKIKEDEVDWTGEADHDYDSGEQGPIAWDLYDESDVCVLRGPIQDEGK